MMNFIYFEPRADIRQYVSSYYDVKIPVGFTDFMRAEIANIRVMLSGYVEWELAGQTYRFEDGDAFLCGPTFAASHVTFSSNAHIFGMAVTPLGWANMFDIPSDKMADKSDLIDAFIPENASQSLSALKACENDSCAGLADNFIAALVQPREDIPEDSVRSIADWLVNPEPTELSDLLDNIDLSHRQVDRLCREYFGASPKKLHRKFRALHSANRLTWKELTDWRDIALTSYYDQSHFIREFKTFNGRTPSEFIKGAHILVRLTLQERLQINHGSPFSLVG